MRQQKSTLPRLLLLLLMCPRQSRITADASKEVEESTLSSTIGMNREHRFPSIDERVKLYMSNWYVPPCSDYKDGYVRYVFGKDNKRDADDEWQSLTLKGPVHPLVNASEILHVENIVMPDLLFYMDQEIIQNCANATFNERIATKRELKVAARVKWRHNMRMYCHDVKDSLLAAWYHVQWEIRSETKSKSSFPPVLLQFGDNKESHTYGDVMVPHLKKFRSAANDQQVLQQVTSKECYSTPRDTLSTVHEVDYKFQPIIWKLATHRHYEKLYQVYRKDTVWNKKKDIAIFLGQLTGSKDGYDKTLTDEENCLRLRRCNMVYKHSNSTLVYAKLTSTRGRLPDVLKGVELVTKKVDLQVLLEYKGIIMIEGNDVASGLKWALLSQSVVLMATPKHTSWAMEELLEPWVHYVPLNDFATDIEEKMQWILDNDEEAQRISERATLWMEDLVFHPDAAEDDRLIQEEIMRRYQAHFQSI